MPFIMLFGQNYNKLWEAVREAEAKDLPKTQMEALQKIVDKATRVDNYGQLLKAGLQQAKVQLNISPGLAPTVSQRPGAPGTGLRAHAARDGRRAECRAGTGVLLR